MLALWALSLRENNMKNIMKGALAALFLLLSASLGAQDCPKREFRGAWLHIVGNQKIKTMSTQEVKDWISSTLDTLQAVNCNAVIFQVRPQADAFFESKLEPWTRFLTGTQGKAPSPYWDPLQFAIEECHKRGMECHAWLNPYRVTSNDKEVLCEDHLYYKRPELFLKYGSQLYFDPGEPDARAHTVNVIKDIVTRYDVDAVHFDDYFYPYPIAGKEFPDDKSFKKYAAQQGFGPDQRADWRRNNVTLLIKEINKEIKAIKPWIRFGISPFGIHRNKKEDPQGSNTNGLSTYDALYADIPLWCMAGYIDYNVPQLYWKIGHKAADYDTLINWWNDGDFGGQLYIGQSLGTFFEPDLKNPQTTQMAAKMKLERDLPNVHGNVWWPGWSLVQGKTHAITDSLRVKYQKYPALIPAYKHIDSIAPSAVKSFSADKSRKVLSWEPVKTDDPMQEAAFFVVYCFPKFGEVNIEDSQYIVAMTRDHNFAIPEKYKGDKHKWVVTVTDHCWNESVPSQPVIL